MTESSISSRTEQARERRKERLKKAEVKPARTRRNTKPAPVVTRGGRVVMPTRPIAASRTRRRYDVSLGTPGAELRLPALPAFRWSWRVVSGLLTLALLWALYTVWNLPAFQVSSAEISGLDRISERDVQLVLGLADTPVFVLRPDIMQANLMEAFPEFSSVTVQVEWPNQVMVQVVERTPVLAWTAGGQTVWVDAQGMSFPVRGEGDGSSLVPVEAQGAPPAPVNLSDLSEADSLAGAGLLSPETTSWNRPFMSVDLVSAVLILRGFAPPDVTLLYDPKYGLGWNDPQGWKVYFGPEGSHMGERLQVYQAIVGQLKQQQITPALISVEYLHAPFYRLDQ